MIIPISDKSIGYQFSIEKGGAGSGIRGHRTAEEITSNLAPRSRSNVSDKLKDELSKREEVYHATANDYSQSIMKNGLKVSKSGKGMISGVYASTQPGESFYYGTHAAVKAFQVGMREGKYTTKDIKNIKVMMVVADKAKFPEAGYAADKENSIFRSKKDIPSDSFKRVEIYKFSDAEAFSKKWQNAKLAKKPLPTMPPPKPISVTSASAKSITPEIFLSFGFMEKEQL